MITIPPIISPVNPKITSPVNPRIQKTQVSEENPHHQRPKDKKDDRNKNDDEIKDEVTLSSQEEKNDNKNKTPPSPMQGHIDIEA